MATDQDQHLRQSVRFGEEYVSSALNQKFAGIISPGVYRGFVVKPGGIMTVAVGHDASGGPSIAVVERDGYNLTILMDDPCMVSIPTTGTWFICIEAFYSVRQAGYQRIVAREQREAHHVVLATVSVTENGVEILSSMISTDDRQQSSIPSVADINTFQTAIQTDIAIRTSRMRKSWKTEKTVTENGTLVLPVPYVTGAHSLLLFYEGLLLDETNFTEIGEAGSISTSVKLLFSVPADSMFCAVTFGTGATGAENTDALKAIDAAVKRANAAADKAEQVAGAVKDIQQQLSTVAERAAYAVHPTATPSTTGA